MFLGDGGGMACVFLVAAISVYASGVVVLQLAAAFTGLIGAGCCRLRVPEYWMHWGLLAAFAAYFAGSQRVWQSAEGARKETYGDRCQDEHAVSFNCERDGFI